LRAASELVLAARPREGERGRTLDYVDSRLSFLFDPADVAKVLDRLPHLRAAIPDPAQEGQESAAFHAMRKSERQLYRVLSNVHYEHLDALLRSLDFCIGRGFTQPTILRTRARSAFAAALSEVYVAEHLLGCGFEVEGLELEKEADPVPELVAYKDSLAIAVEVYAPLEWEGLGELMDELTSALKNLDLPLDYRFEARVEQLEQFDAEHRLLFIHPGELARGLDGKTRERVVTPLLDEVERRLRADEREVRVAHEEHSLNIRVRVEVEDVEQSRDRLPARWGVSSPPGLSGYAPEGMFDRLVHRRVRRKAARRQAPRSQLAPLSLLVVDLARAELTSELSHSGYRARFEQTLRERLGDGLLGYDLIAFCESRSGAARLQLHFLMSEDAIEPAAREALFGDQLAR
jgi:hypothetical protein